MRGLIDGVYATILQYREINAIEHRLQVATKYSYQVSLIWSFEMLIHICISNYGYRLEPPGKINYKNNDKAM